jgi:nucleoside-triphosphatase THEP1
MASAMSKIAAVMGVRSATVQPLFAALVADWRAAGAAVAGVIAEPHGPESRVCTAGVLRDIITGEPYQIHLETPPQGRSCDIDAGGVEDACKAVLSRLATSDLVVLSKFGKLETQRMGLADAFEAAIAAGKPVLTTVSDRHADAWRALAVDGISLPADPGAIRAWWSAVRS